MLLHDERLTLTPAEAAKIMGVGINTMYELTHSKGFPVINVGRKKLIVRSKFEEWLEKQIGENV